MLIALGIVVFCGVTGSLGQDYEVPAATVEVFRPKGFRISIPDQDGIKLFAFHGKLNEEFNGREAGTWARDITKAKDGRWTFVDTQTKLKVGDVLYYWLTVHYFDGEKELGFYRDDQEFVVQEVQPLPGNGNGNGGGPPGQNKKTTPRPPQIQSTPPSCQLSKTVINDGKPVCKGKLIFQDEFQTIDSTKWKKDVLISGNPDYQFVIYMNFPENIGVTHNNLYIKPTLAVDKYGENFINEQINLGRNCTGIPGTTECDRKSESYQILPPIFSGRLSTKELFSFRYGVVEIRAKLPKGDWIYPELFLQPKKSEYGLGYDSGQIRIAFCPGNENLGKELQAGIILGTSPEGRNFGIRKINNEENVDWSDHYHTFQISWKPERISVSVDGLEYGTIDMPDKGFSLQATNLKSSAGPRWAEGLKNAPFDKEMYLLFGLGVGGHNFPDTVQGKPWKNISPKNTLKFWTDKNNWFNTWTENSVLKVDYVKVWAL